MHLVSACLLPLFAGFAAAQDALFYEFDANCFHEVINYGRDPLLPLPNGTLESTSPGSPWTSGFFGDALAGGNSLAGNGQVFFNRVRTGWQPSAQPLAGDVTIAFFIRERVPLLGATGYLHGTPALSGFRLFTNGIANRGLYQRNILISGGNAGVGGVDLQLPASIVDVQQLAAARFVHVAIVVDSAAGTADWYIDGLAVLQLTGVGGALINSSGEFMIGYQQSASHFDFDEFVLSTRAYTPQQIQDLARRQHAGDGVFFSGTTSQCGTLPLFSGGGVPTLGNQNYRLVLGAQNNGFFVVMVGLERCLLGGQAALPITGQTVSPLATGCWLLVDNVTSVTGVVTGGGPAAIPFAIPGASQFAGFNVFLQAALMTTAAGSVEASNGFAVTIGN